MSDPDRDLFGHPVHVAPRQLGLSLGMGVSIRWGSSCLRVSSDAETGTIRLSAVDLPDLGPRWAEALKAFWPGRKAGELDAKACARALECAPDTAEGWAAGQAPRGEYMWRAFRKHGLAFLVALAPELAPPTTMELLSAAEALRSTSAGMAAILEQIAAGSAGEGA